jgi:hypothetical protein
LNYAGYEGFRLTHELDTNKSKSETIYRSVRSSIFGAVIGTYLADIVRNLFVERKEKLKDIITDISPIESYIGTVAGGTTGGLAGIYLNSIPTSSISSATNKIASNYTRKSLDKTYLDDYELGESIITDNIAIGIILYVFGFDLYQNDNMGIAKGNIFIEQLVVFFVINIYFIARTPFIVSDLED